MSIATRSLNKKKVIFDIILNIIASSLPIVMLQLIIYPQIAKTIGAEEYGLMLTIYSIWIMVSNSLGSVLNNIKLLYHFEYKKMGESGDLPFLFQNWIVLGSVLVFVIIWLYYGYFSFTHVILGTLVSLVIYFKAYLEVGFRIDLNYINILINNAILCLGFLLGYLLFLFTNIWELIFLFGYLFSTIFCIFKTNLLKEKKKKTDIYPKVRRDAYSLVLSSLITNMTIYADKLVLYPLMGGTAVSIYYTATILGKITGMLTGPINSVILSYISRWDKTRANVFSKVMIIGFLIISAGYLFTLLIARPVIGLLFPQWLDEVMEIVPLTTITVMLTILVTILQPFVLRFCRLEWQIAISSCGLVVYFFCAIGLWKYMGLKGFCIGTIIGVFVKLIIMITVYYKSLNNAK